LVTFGYKNILVTKDHALPVIADNCSNMRSIKTLVNNDQTAGYRSIQWNATNDLGQPVSAGMYIYTIQAGEFRQTKKMVLLK